MVSRASGRRVLLWVSLLGAGCAQVHVPAGDASGRDAGSSAYGTRYLAGSDPCNDQGWTSCDCAVGVGIARCAGGAQGPCECKPPLAPDGPEPPGGCAGEAEQCDGYDRDCDGEVDEACLDATVRGTLPFTGTVWRFGYALESGSCSEGSFQSFWPTMEPPILGDVPCIERYPGGPYRVGPDGAVYFGAFFPRAPTGMSGLRRVAPDGTQTVAETPPCTGRAIPRWGGFAFGADGALYYRCGDTVYRDGVELPVEGRIEAVLESGALLLTGGVVEAMADLAWLVRPDGEVLWEHAVSGVRLGIDSATVAGDSVFLAAIPIGGPDEWWMLRIDADGTETRVRRVPEPVDSRLWADERLLALPDGRFYYGNLEIPVSGPPREVEPAPAHRYWAHVSFPGP